MLEGWDYIKATRFSKGGGWDEGIPFMYYVISRCGNIFAKMATGLPITIPIGRNLLIYKGERRPLK